MTKDTKTPPTGMRVRGGPSMSEQELHDLPATIHFVTAGRALGLSRATCYELLRTGQFPVDTFRIGSTTKVAKHKLMAYLGLRSA